jgi:hypothetical protein
MTGTEPHAPRGTAGRGPTGTVGRALTTPELQGSVRSCTAGCGLNRDHGQCTGRGSYASTHAHLGTSGRETLWGSLAASGPEELSTRGDADCDHLQDGCVLRDRVMRHGMRDEFFSRLCPFVLQARFSVVVHCVGYGNVITYFELEVYISIICETTLLADFIADRPLNLVDHPVECIV